MVRPELDRLPTEAVVALLLDNEATVVPALQQCRDALAASSVLIADRVAAGGRIVLVGAGTSGRIAAAEAAELPGTFGLDRATVVSCLAGDVDADEDDLDAATRDIASVGLRPDDVLVAVAASGSTPYTLAIAEAAGRAGAAVVAVVNVADSPIAALAAVAVEIPTGAEVLRGSTRLTAGTAQKIALNTITTAAMARLGRVHGDLMVDVEPANAKLHARASAIVAEIAGSSIEDAGRALGACGGNARAAVLLIMTGSSPDAALAAAARHRTLREALAASRSGNGANESPPTP